MKRKIVGSVLIIGIFLLLIFSNRSNTSTTKVVSYNGNKLLISIDGNNSDTLPTSGNYYLTKYKCGNKNTKVTWNNDTHELSVSNGNNKGGVACNLTFKSKPLLSDVEPGSYVAYTGNNGCSGEACNGQNANYVSDTDMGYCRNSSHKFTVNGWRVGYISDGTAYLVSAGAPECYVTSIESVSSSTSSKTLSTNYYYGGSYYLNPSTGYFELRGVTSSTVAWSSNYESIISDTPYTCMSPTKPVEGSTTGACTTLYKIDSYFSSTKGLAYTYYNFEITDGAPIHLANLNSEALKYCNSDYAYGESCNESSARAMNATDFENITGSVLSSSSCYQSHSNMSCGYNNDLIDNGGYYWYATPYNSASSYNVFTWIPLYPIVSAGDSGYSYGVRPVLRLQSSVYVTGGSGSYKDPYTIGNYSFSINNGDLYTKSNSVTLKFVGDNVATMCVSNTSDCSSYETFAASKSWTLTSGDGEKTVYVYYKDGDGNIVASMSRSITVDSVAPTNNSISVSSVSGNSATLSVSSSGANYMCFSSTNDSSGCSWVSYATSYKYKFDKTNGSKTIYGFFKDYAGNMSSTSVSYSCTTCENAFEVNYPFDGSKTIAQMNAEGLITIAGTSSDSAYDWVIDSTNKYFKSGNYNVNSSTGSSTITFTPTMDCSLSFDYGVDSESNFDKLTITLNDGSTDTTLVNAISGSKTGSITNQALTGDTTYVLKLKYVKDSSNHKNHDIGYIKNFVIE